uniref:Uncharacterized protein n=1 Tax=Arundo donax TaxID=35708 RepID=A0A0A9ATG2_ARUDO
MFIIQHLRCRVDVSCYTIKYMVFDETEYGNHYQTEPFFKYHLDPPCLVFCNSTNNTAYHHQHINKITEISTISIFRFNYYKSNLI